MSRINSKRFIFATISVICASITAILLKYDGETYLKLVGIIVSVYTFSQSITDHKKIDGSRNE